MVTAWQMPGRCILDIRRFLTCLSPVCGPLNNPLPGYPGGRVILSVLAAGGAGAFFLYRHVQLRRDGHRRSQTGGDDGGLLELARDCGGVTSRLHGGGNCFWIAAKKYSRKNPTLFGSSLASGNVAALFARDLVYGGI